MTPLDTSTTRSLFLNTKVYIAAEKFDIPALKSLAARNYEDRALAHWNSPEFSESADLLWTNIMDTDRQMRDIVVAVAIKKVKELHNHGEFVELMTEYGCFCLDVLREALGLKLCLEVDSDLENEAPDDGSLDKA